MIQYYAPGIIRKRPTLYLFRAEQGQPESKREYYILRWHGLHIQALGYIPGIQTILGSAEHGLGKSDFIPNPVLRLGRQVRAGKCLSHRDYTTNAQFRLLILNDVLTDLMDIVQHKQAFRGNFDHIDDQTNFTKGTIGDDLP